MTFVRGDVVQGRYRVDGLLGQGGMGTVYRATHLGLGAPVALKVMHILSADDEENQRFARQFETEARILAAMNHPRLAHVSDFFEDDRLPCLVMELIEGRTLEQVVLQDGPMSEARALEIAGQLLEALAYLHERPAPVIVRDLKPSNVMLDAGGVRLIDFGIAKVARPGESTRSVISGAGTHGFAPLEQYGQGSTDARTDLYALGATLVYLLTGQVPADASRRVTEGAPLPDVPTLNPTVSTQLWQTLQALLAIAPAERPASAREAAVRLDLGLPGPNPAVDSGASEAEVAVASEVSQAAVAAPSGPTLTPLGRTVRAVTGGAPQGDDQRPDRTMSRVAQSRGGMRWALVLLLIAVSVGVAARIRARQPLLAVRTYILETRATSDANGALREGADASAVMAVLRRRFERMGIAPVEVVPSPDADPRRLVLQVPASTSDADVETLVRSRGQVDLRRQVRTQGTGRLAWIDALTCTVQSAEAEAAPEGAAWVMLRLDPRGRDRLGEVSRSVVGQALGVFVDGEMIAAPVLRGPVTDGVLHVGPIVSRVVGRSNLEAAADLAALLGSGVLPCEVGIVFRGASGS